MLWVSTVLVIICAINTLLWLKCKVALTASLLSCSTDNQAIFTINHHARSVLPTGVCVAYGAPEHLRSVQLQRQGRWEHEEALINGPAADMWSFGAVVYEMVTCCSATLCMAAQPQRCS